MLSPVSTKKLGDLQGRDPWSGRDRWARRRCPTSFRGAGLMTLALVLGVFGCSDDDRPGGIDDCIGANCGTPGGGGSTTPTEAGTDAPVDGDASQDVAVSVVDLSGAVVRLADLEFMETVPYTGWGYLRVPTPSGDAEVAFGGEAGPGFTATGVVTGDGWFTVVPDASFFEAGVVDVLTTYAYLRVPDGGATGFEVPVVDRTVLSILYAAFTQPTTVRADAAHVVVAFERDGQRVAGVQVTSAPTAEAVAFGTGVGFSAEATETGNNGIALLVNVVGTGPLGWLTPGGEAGTLSVVHVPGQASFVRIEVP